MKKRFLIIFVTVLLLGSIFFFSACGFFSTGSKYKIGYLSSTTAESYVKGFSNLQAVGYATSQELVNALKNGDVDYAVLDNAPAKHYSTAYSAIKNVSVALTTEAYAFVFSKDESADAMYDAANSMLQAIKANGNLNAIIAKYLGSTADIVPYENPTVTTDEGLLVVAVDLEFEPFEYTVDGNKFAGIDIELAKLLADELNLTLYVQAYTGSEVNFEEDIVKAPTRAATEGKFAVDVSISAITKTTARAQYVRFSSYTYYDASLNLLVKSTDTTFDEATTKAAVEEKLSSLKK